MRSESSQKYFSRKLSLYRAAWLRPFLLLVAVPAFAQGGASPWENAVNALKTSFTGPIATGLSLVAIVVGGLMFSQLVTLYLTPVFYTYMATLQTWVGSKKKKKIVHHKPVETPA